jgi:hypothetical protein
MVTPAQHRRIMHNLLCLSAALLGGCGTVHFNSAATSLAKYRAYGDSITYGATLSGLRLQAYPSLVGYAERVTFVNNAKSGDQACDVPARQIFPNLDSPDLQSRPTYSLLIGTNDVDLKGTGAYEAVFALCHLATLTWLGVPVEHKVLATGAAMAASGPGSLDTSNHWNAWTTGGLGASVQFKITTTAPGPIYAWPIIDDAISVEYAYSLDGVQSGIGNTQTRPAIITQNGSTKSLGFIRLSCTAERAGHARCQTLHAFNTTATLQPMSRLLRPTV